MEYEQRTFLGALPAADQDRLLAGVGVRRFAHEDIVLTEGDDCTDVAVLLTGRVKLVAHSSTGQNVLLGIRGPGDLLGELSAFGGGPRSADAVALEPCTAAFTTGAALHRHATERPAVAESLLRMLSERLREADRSRVLAASHNAKGRLAAHLLELVRLYGVRVDGGFRFDLPINQDELAGWIGVSRQSAARALAQLRADGLVGGRRRTIVVNDVEGLRAIT